ncbi:hypothetical protein CANMA_004020 [Candida margitis]|uniref:uncharacterized protein n=1 Tax=Candida margitis TaxID=1775924 RepID=UPI00222717D6|nr:uncharacterized protein CANMA_004020 [Candida margitis]KAI5960240.1 hypothetical protein CANMA_004020 [Candida margitis]
MPQAKASSFSQDNHNSKFQTHHSATSNNNDKRPRQPLGEAFDLSSLSADLPPNTGPPGTVSVTNGPSSNASKNLSHVPCKFFKQGNCQAGDSCPFSHNVEGALAADKLPCKYFLRGNCKFGLKCALAHYLPDGTRVNAKNILASNGNNNGAAYSNHSYGLKHQKYGNSEATSYSGHVNQRKNSPEYEYGRITRPIEDLTPRSRYTSVSPPDSHSAGIASLSNAGYYNSYQVKQQPQPSQPPQQQNQYQQPVFQQFGQQQQQQQQPQQPQQQLYPFQQQQQQHYPQQQAQPRNISHQEAPISFNTLTDDSLARFTKQPQHEHPTPPRQEPLSWSPVAHYAKPADYSYTQWGSQQKRTDSHHQPHSLGSNSFSNTFTDGPVFNTPTTKPQNNIRRSYSTGGQYPTIRTAHSPPQSSTVSGINIQSSTPSATTPSSRFSFSSGASTALSQVNDYSLPVKANISSYSYQNISLASPVFDDEEGVEVEDKFVAKRNEDFDYSLPMHQSNANGVFEEDFLPSSLADVVLSPQELKRRDSRSQSGTLNNRPSLRALLEETGYTGANEPENVFLME